MWALGCSNLIPTLGGIKMYSANMDHGIYRPCTYFIYCTLNIIYYDTSCLYNHSDVNK